MTKHFPKTDNVQHLLDLIASGLTVKDLSFHFGAHSTSINGWLREDKAPLWTLLAAKGLQAQKAHKPPPIEVITLITNRPTERELLRMLLDNLGIPYTSTIVDAEGVLQREAS
jgi:hypothetical protein